MSNRPIAVISSLVAAMLCTAGAYGDNGPTGREHEAPGTGSLGRAAFRNEFISYDTRKASEAGDRNATEYFVPLQLSASQKGGDRVLGTSVNIPFVWVDRDLFLHVEGFPAFYVKVNGTTVAYSQDSKCPSEFFISPHVGDGVNSIEIVLPAESCGQRLEDALAQGGSRGYDVFLYSQPKVRIEDYNAVTTPDSSGRHMVFDLEVAVSNSYNSDETFMVGFDLYSPEGKLETYDIREVRVEGNGRDTVRFRELIYHAMAKRWSVQSPKLYKATVFVRRESRIVEYVPFKVGFGSVEYGEKGITRNGAALDMAAARYAGTADKTRAEEDLDGLKARGINTVWLDTPQPSWFYDLCDRIGMNVIDQANINFTGDPENMAVGGTLSNDPKWRGAFIERILAMYSRNRQHVCIAGLSLGGDVGNGYNMYEGYRRLKAVAGDKAVLFRDAEGYWNNDVNIGPIKDAAEVLAMPLPAKTKSSKRR